MPFDPTTAVLAKPSFDPGTARPSFGFDPSTAVEDSPYTAVIREAEAFQRRAAANTPEAIGRAATAPDITEVPVGTGLGGTLTIPRAVAEPLLTAGPRVALPLATAVGLGSGVGTLPTIGALLLSGGAGEFLGQTAEKELGQRKDYSVGEGLLNTALTPVTVGPLRGVQSPLLRMGVRGLEGAALSGVQDVGTRAIRGEEQDLGATLRQAALPGAVLGTALGTGELAGGRRLAGAAEAGFPAELIPVGREMREPRMPLATDIAPTELDAIRQAEAISSAEQATARASGERAVASLDEQIDAERVRKLGERMMGKTPEQQLAVLDQEMRLQKDVLTVAEQRAGLDLKQELQRQIQAQKAMEEAASAQGKALADAQKAAKEQERLATEAAQPPKSTQILAEPTAKPPSIANVATEVATQTKNSPYALQAKLNEMTAAPTQPEITPAGPLAGEISEAKAAPATFAGFQEGIGKTPGFDLYNLTEDIPGHPTGSTVSRATLEQAGFKVPEKTNPLRALLDKLDNGEEIYTGRDLRDDVEGLYERGEMPDKLQKAMDEYDALRKADYEEFGARSGLEGEGEDAFIAAVRSMAGKETKAVSRPSAKTKEPKVDVSPILNAATELEAVTIGGRLMRENNSAQNMRAIQKAMQEYKPKASPTPNAPAPAIKPPEAPALAPAEPAGEGGAVAGTEAVAPRTQEQRLNDADIGLPPVSALTRTQKRAELDAAGVKTYKGKPLDDINPAELSAAVGKLRRGESLEVPADIIDRLEARKINTRGKQYDATAGIPIAAYNAAIDTAIVAIRAGRALAEVVRMAIAQYRKMHPSATDEDITRLAQDIEVAHGYGDPTPGRTEAEQIVADAGALEAAPGRSPEATAAASRMRQTRGAISPAVLTPLATAASTGVSGYALTEREPGETDERYQARRLRNAGLAAAGGFGAGVAVSALARASRDRLPAKGATPGPDVPLPEVGPGEGIRRTAEKVITNKSYPTLLRTTLAEDPEIIYNKISRNQIRETVKGSTDAELQAMLASPDQNMRVGALAELGNRAAVTPGMEAEGARLHRELAKNFTAPAQLLGLGGLVESPQAMVNAVKDTLNQSVPAGKKAPQISPASEKKLFDLATASIKAEQRLAKAERAARDDFNPATKAEFISARSQVGETKKALADYTKDILPERYGQIVSKIIKGNLLAPLSFAKNAFGNAAWQGLLRGSETIATGLDAVYSQARDKPRTMALGSPLPNAEELGAFADGVRVAGKELLTGPSADSYIKSEIQRGFHPIRSMLQVFSGLPAAERVMERRGIASLPRVEGKVRVNDRVKKFIEGTLGIPPEASFRLLNLGDKPVRSAVQQRILTEQANLRGLKGVEREKFMLLPDDETQALMESEGLGGVLAQENKLATRVGKIFDTGLVDIAEAMGQGRPAWLEDVNKIAGTLMIPYRQFPANFAITAANFAIPPIAFTRGAVQAARGNRREALRNYGEGLMGSMFLGAAGYLWDKGLISEPADPKDKKRRSAQYETMGAQRLNVSGIQRLANGEDPTYRRGDDTRDWSSIGPAAASFYVFTKAKSKDLNKAARTGDKAEERSDLEVLLNLTDAAGFAFDQSFLAGTSAFIDALQDWDNYGDKFVQNTFRAITSIPAPNSLEAFNRTQYKFIPEQKGDTLAETLKNVWNYKTGQLTQDERANYKRDLWGNPVPRTPEGQNPYIAQFLDVTKAETKQPDKFKQSLLELYQQTRSTDVYPPLVTRFVNNQGTTVELTPDDYDTLQDFTGQAREEFGKRIAGDPRFADPELIPEKKLMALAIAWREGAKIGQSQLYRSEGFRQRYPELFGDPAPVGHKSRVVGRDVKARGALRLQGQ